MTTTYNPTYGYLKTKSLDIGSDGENESTTYGFISDNATEWLFGMRNNETVTYSTPARANGTPAETKTRVTGFDPDPAPARSEE